MPDPEKSDGQWTLPTRVFFRFVFCYFLLYIFFGGIGSPLEALPFVGTQLDRWLQSPINLLSLWAGRHIFHLTGREAVPHIQATGDDPMRWAAVAVVLVLALAVTMVWSILDRRRKNYSVLLGWFRLALRFELGVVLLWYGFVKVFPIQFPMPPLALLNEPVGNSSPTLLFWSVYGLHPWFVMTLGWIEVIAGMLLFFRRTAFCGALIALGVTTNIALLNLAFDVPVKLFSLSLVTIAVVLLIPEVGLLRDLFWRHQAVTSNSSAWAPRLTTRRSQHIMLAVEITVAVLACARFSAGTWPVWHTKAEAIRAPAPFTGEWKIEGESGILGGNGVQIVTMFFEPNTDTYMRATDSALWRSRAFFDRRTKRLEILYPIYGSLIFTVSQPTTDTLVLTPAGASAHQFHALQLHRVPLPDAYPLLAHRFHWVDRSGELR